METATSTRGLPGVPLRAPLSAKYKDTFAYPTIKDRCPVILCKVIDHLHRERNNIGRDLGQEAMEGLYKVVEELSKLRYEMQTDKPIVDIVDDTGNALVWNDYLKKQKNSENNPTWYRSAWLWVECYMYRRISQALNLTGVKQLRNFDFFEQQKKEGFYGSLSSMKMLGKWVLDELDNTSDLDRTWTTLVQVCLWGNKCDLSISAGDKSVASGDPIAGLNDLYQNILADNSREAWNCLSSEGNEVHIVMDNSGFELFTDLCLADFLISSKRASKVVFRVKDQPWFVSDTTPNDIEWSLEQLTKVDKESDSLNALGTKWKSYLQSGVWSVIADRFWTFPHSYHYMLEEDPSLYRDLEKAILVIFKGDLNYRKLVGDLNWETTVPFKTALKGFLPTSILTLRTAKADVIVGLLPGQAEKLTEKDAKWMVTGQWGMIQLAVPEH